MAALERFCLRNPNGFKGYGATCWGPTASDAPHGYNAFALDKDMGVIAPTAALGSMPYTPEYSLAALHHFLGPLRRKLWREYGFVDAFCETQDWYAHSHLAIDQGPIIMMTENYRDRAVVEAFHELPREPRGLASARFREPASRLSRASMKRGLWNGAC